MATFTYSGEHMRRSLFALAQKELETAKEQAVIDATAQFKNKATEIMAKYALQISEQEGMARIGLDVRIELVDRSAL